MVLIIQSRSISFKKNKTYHQASIKAEKSKVIQRNVLNQKGL